MRCAQEYTSGVFPRQIEEEEQQVHRIQQRLVLNRGNKARYPTELARIFGRNANEAEELRKPRPLSRAQQRRALRFALGEVEVTVVVLQIPIR